MSQSYLCAHDDRIEWHIEQRPSSTNSFSSARFSTQSKDDDDDDGDDDDERDVAGDGEGTNCENNDGEDNDGDDEGDFNNDDDDRDARSQLGIETCARAVRNATPNA